MNPRKSMIYTNPTKLKRGDLISIVSPSAGLAPFAMHRIIAGKKSLEDLGFKVKVEKNALKNNGYVSGTIKERVADLHSAFKDKKVKAIICTIGGNHSNQLLKYLDWDLIKKNPKIFLGYSDISVLHCAIYKKTNLRTFYGPCLIPEFGEYPKIPSYTKEYFEKALVYGEIDDIKKSKEWTDEFLDWFKKEDLTRARKVIHNDGFIWWKKGKTIGEIWGGCIPSLNHLLGTEYWCDLKNKILFIDLPEGHNPSENLPISNLDACLADMYNVGVFSQIKGLVIGRPYGYRNSAKKLSLLKEVVMNYTKNTNYPILFNADIGHTSPMITIPFGAKIELDSKKNKFEIKKGFID